MHPEQRPNPARSPEALEAWLRELPPLPVPANLEARLMAAIPAPRPARPRRWAVWVGVAAALAAACLLVVLAWPRRDSKEPDSPILPTPPSAHQGTPQPADDSDSLAAWRALDEEALPAFTWPLRDSSPSQVSISITFYLFD